jgi:hypothetical protein
MQRGRPDAGTIFPEPLLRSYSTLFALMQGFRKRLVFRDEVTYSILTFPLKTVVEGGNRLNFDYRDNLSTLSLYLRLEGVGLIVALEDCGLSERGVREEMAYLEGRTLHPLQFMEIAGTIASWQAHLLTTPDVLVFDREDSIEVLGSFKPRMRPYDPVLKAKLVSSFTNLPLDDILMPDGAVWTSLRDDAGEFVDMPLTSEQNATLLYRPTQL